MPQQQQQQQQPSPFQNQQQQRPQPLLQNPPSNQQQQFPSQQAAINNSNPNLSLQAQNPLGINQSGVAQQNSLDSWFALYAAALNNPQVAQQQQQPQPQIQPQQDANSITQQWSQWLKTAQMVTINFFFFSFLKNMFVFVGSNSTTTSSSINSSTT
jgi:cell division protein FtsX